MHKDHIKKEIAKKELQKIKTSEEEIEKKLDQLEDVIEAVKDIHKEMYKKVCHLTEWFQTRIEVQHMESKGFELLHGMLSLQLTKSALIACRRLFEKISLHSRKQDHVVKEQKITS